MGVKEMWREITQETISLHLDHVPILHSLFYRARKRREEEDCHETVQSEHGKIDRQKSQTGI